MVKYASVKGQCAKNYLYGDDLQLEFIFQYLERGYARAIRNIEDRHHPANEEEIELLRAFMLLQYSRTEASIKRTTSAVQDIHNTFAAHISIPPPEIHKDDSFMMNLTLSMLGDLYESTSDLKIYLARNFTNHDFVTSDDPVVLTSRFHAQKINSNNFGVASAGALFFLPLSPRLLLICYDGDVYTASNKTGFILHIRAWTH